MVSGAECSTSGNALRQFTKHFNEDPSLQRERFQQAGPSSAGPSMRTARQGMGTDDQQ
ncbi:hypothetical protein BGZ83_001484, partial [Gryganskiella cystojenkinii]